MIITRRISKISKLSGKTHEMDLKVTKEQLFRYAGGKERIQDVFPHLNADEREFLMTGITAKEWKDAFGEEEQ